MSTTTDVALGSRENFWGDDDTDAEQQGGHREVAGTDAAEYVAHQLVLDIVAPVCERQRSTPPWNGGRLAELVAWLVDDERVDGRGDQLHHERREVELTAPALYLPKQTEVGSRLLDYGVYPNRRRWNPETGYVNWGETTATGVPEFGEEVFRRAVHTYLLDRGVRWTEIEDYLERAHCFWHDPQFGSKASLEQFVRYVREQEQ